MNKNPVVPIASLAVSVFFLLLVLIPHFSFSASSCCQYEEQQAFSIKALQSYLMVAALSCDQSHDYNSFIKQFSKELNFYGSTLKTYFTKHYPNQSEKRLNSFVTALANEASDISLQTNYSTFCNSSKKLFHQILQDSEKSLLKAHYPQTLQPSYCHCLCQQN